eukprot:gnl/TRDRNA2_/TRDRNA2_119611_c1_seq1.p1 gnl/TRDRNA2_/TRDRNA2_119611_c1~~gnl/TRDRNA2_/TRDRNA2_119611_c1_seq1.p1  ORF type:complete len:194 (+),score=60.20 gnl/TRDRNA2_/TRDRNA2_119611_c1_seq1:65-583(+)
MQAAEEAVNCLSKKDIDELKQVKTPTEELDMVSAACAFLLKNEKKRIGWKEFQKMLQNPSRFLEEAKCLDASNIPEQTLKNIQPFLEMETFTFDVMRKKSSAAASLCQWVIKIMEYNKIYQKVAPLVEQLRAATEKAQQADAELAIKMKQIADAEADCARLDAKLQRAVVEK